MRAARTTGTGAPVEPPKDGEPWTVLQLVRWSAGWLAGKGVEGGRLEVEHLLAHVLEMGRLDLYLHFDRPVSAPELERFRPLLLQRAARKPLQYILGRCQFRDLELLVDERVLIPRPETEELVGVVLQRTAGREGLRALDVGTGSGAIALALASEGPFARVIATDRSPEALEVARENARRTGLSDRVEFREGSLLDPVADGERFDVLVSNPPYVSWEEFEALAPEVREWEPSAALVAAEEGMALARALVRGAGRVLPAGGLLALEVGAAQARRLAEEIGELAGWGAPEIVRDLQRRERIILARREGGKGTEGVEEQGRGASPRRPTTNA